MMKAKNSRGLSRAKASSTEPLSTTHRSASPLLDVPSRIFPTRVRVTIPASPSALTPKARYSLGRPISRKIST
ncbi:hypothetical protein D3C71_1937010 [compost metagenome]